MLSAEIIASLYSQESFQTRAAPHLQKAQAWIQRYANATSSEDTLKPTACAMHTPPIYSGHTSQHALPLRAPA